MPLAASAGRTLAEPLAARRTQPPFPASAMDGYAVRAADATTTAQLRVIGMSAAGHRFAGKVGAGEAVRIFTGAPVPPGADAVLIQEDADVVDAKTIRAKELVSRGKNIREAGLDFRQGEELLAAGAKLGMREVSIAAAMDHATVAVRRRPVVAIIATGDELVPPGRVRDRIRSSPPTVLALRSSSRRMAAKRATSASSATRRRPLAPRSIAPAPCRPIFSSPSAAPRSASTISSAMFSPARAWRSTSGRSPCDRESR